MVAIIVGTHGKFSKALIESSKMIFGTQENIKGVTFEPGESPDDLVQRYRDMMKELDCKDGLLFMVDLFGGSPYNAASRIAIENENMDIITGVNLPMLLEVFALREFSSIGELVDTALNSASCSIKSFKSSLNSDIEEEL